MKLLTVVALVASAVVFPAQEASGGRPARVPRVVQINDLHGDANVGEYNEIPADLAALDIQKVWFEDDERSISVTIQITEPPRPSDNSIFVVETRPSGIGDECLYFFVTFTPPRAEGYVQNSCAGESLRRGTVRTHRIRDGSSLVTLKVPRAGVPALEAGDELVDPWAWSNFMDPFRLRPHHRLPVAAWYGWVDTTRYGIRYELKQSLREKRCRRFAPFIPRDSHAENRREALKAPIVPVRPSHTVYEPLEVRFLHDVAADIPPFVVAGHTVRPSFRADNRFFNVQVAAPSGYVLHARLVWQPDPSRDFDLYAYDGSGRLVAGSAAVNVGGREAETLQNSAPTGRGYMGSEYVAGIHGTACEGFTLESDAVRNLNTARMTLQLWLQRPNNDRDR